MVMSKKYEVSFHHYAVIHPKNTSFNFCLETIATAFTTYVITTKIYISSLNTTFTTPWLWKRNKDFSTYCYYFHCAMILTKKYFFAVATMLTTLWFWQKSKLFFIPTLLSLHNYHEDKILFCYCYYVHYAMITTRNKLIFIPTLPSLHNCHEKNTTVLFLKDSCMVQ